MEQRLLFRIWLNEYGRSPLGSTTGRVGNRGAHVELEHLPGLPAAPRVTNETNEIIDTRRDTRDDLRHNLGAEDPTNN